MSKIKQLIKNIGFLVLSQFSIKILNFLLVPLYTSILTTSEYGTYDLFNTTIALLIPFLTQNIKDSTLRFSLGANEDNLLKVFTVSIVHVIKSVFLVAIILILNHIFKCNLIVDEYAVLIFFMFLSQTAVMVMTNFVRGLDNLKDISISSVICSFSIILLNIITLIYFRIGIKGYFIANITGPVIQFVYLFIKCKCWHYVSINEYDKEINKEMLSYARPLILNTTAWWINSVSDRYIIVMFCGTAVNGIYAVASKIPSILDMFQNIFSQAWTLSAVKEFDPNDTDGFFTNMYNMYNMAMTIMCSCLIIISRFLSKLLYANAFYKAWMYVPFLIIAVLFGALSGYIGAIFSAVKDSKVYSYSTIIGAIVNLGFNLVFVKRLGALGASIATALCYWIIYVIRLHNSKKYIRMELKLARDYCAYFILVIQTILLISFQQEWLWLYFVEFGLLLIIIVLFNMQIKQLFIMIKRLIRH